MSGFFIPPLSKSRRRSVSLLERLVVAGRASVLFLLGANVLLLSSFRFWANVPVENLTFGPFFCLFLLFWLLATDFVRFLGDVASTIDDFPYWPDEISSERRRVISETPIWFLGIFFVGTTFSFGCSATFFLCLILHEIVWFFAQDRLATEIFRAVERLNIKTETKSTVERDFNSETDGESGQKSPCFNSSLISSLEKKTNLFSEIRNADEESDEIDDENQLQRSRRFVEEGVEKIEGTVRASFLPNEETAIVHLAFSPPFATIPDFQSEQSTGDFVQIKLSQLQPFGARIELKRNDFSSSGNSVQICYYASCPLDENPV